MTKQRAVDADALLIQKLGTDVDEWICSTLASLFRVSLVVSQEGDIATAVCPRCHC